MKWVLWFFELVNDGYSRRSLAVLGSRARWQRSSKLVGWHSRVSSTATLDEGAMASEGSSLKWSLGGDGFAASKLIVKNFNGDRRELGKTKMATTSSSRRWRKRIRSSALRRRSSRL